MQDQDIRSVVRGVVEDVLELDPEELRDSGDFANDYGCNSLQFLGLLQAMERRLGLRYLPIEVEQMGCVDDVVRLTQRRIAARAAV
jgi:acyl carrier protein